MPAPPTPGSARASLAHHLRSLRAATGMSGNALARHLDWQQSRVSKLETGVQLPTEEDLESWTAATRGDTLADLLDLLGRARVEYSSFRNEFFHGGGAAGKQVSVAEREREANTISSFVPAMIPGLLQTPAYARDLLNLPSGPKAWGASDEDVEAMVERRVERQSILYSTGSGKAQAFLFVLGEAALWTRFGSVETHREQLDRLVAFADLRAVELHIAPFDRPMPVIPLTGFKIHDEELVIVESAAGEQLLTEAEHITKYSEFFDQLRGHAVGGADAVDLVRSVSHRLTVV